MFLTGLDYFCSMRWSVVFKTFPLKGKVYLFVLCCFHPETADVKPGHDLRESHVSGLIAFHSEPGMSYLQLKRIIEKKNTENPLKIVRDFLPLNIYSCLYFIHPLLAGLWKITF